MILQKKILKFYAVLLVGQLVGQVLAGREETI